MSKSLRRLDLHELVFDDSAVTFLLAIPNLERVRLFDTDVSPVAVEAMRSAKPALLVENHAMPALIVEDLTTRGK
jgi:hypothetical protein